MENKEKYCPNILYDSNNVSIGEFKTLEDYMEFPIHDIWCVNRIDDNLFEKYKTHGYRVLIICSWERGDRWRFVIALKKGTRVSYYDLNDLPMDLVCQQYEKTLGDDAVSIIKNR